MDLKNHPLLAVGGVLVVLTLALGLWAMFGRGGGTSARIVPDAEAVEKQANTRPEVPGPGGAAAAPEGKEAVVPGRDD
jgi:hypothetical protein